MPSSRFLIEKQAGLLAREIRLLFILIASLTFLRGTFLIRVRDVIERQLFWRDVEIVLEHRNNQHMVRPLRKPRYGDRADTASAFDKDWESAALRCEIAQIRARLCLKSGLVALVRQTDGVGTPVKTDNDITLA